MFRKRRSKQKTREMSAPVRGPEVDTNDIASPRSPENDEQEKNPDVSEHDSGAEMSEEEEENRQRLMGEKVSLLPDFKADLPDWLDETLITDTSDGSSVRVEGKSILQVRREKFDLNFHLTVRRYGF